MSGLPLTVITKLAVLCTRFVSDIPSRDRRCDEIARQELSVSFLPLFHVRTVREMEEVFLHPIPQDRREINMARITQQALFSHENKQRLISEVVGRFPYSPHDG